MADAMTDVVRSAPPEFVFSVLGPLPRTSGRPAGLAGRPSAASGPGPSASWSRSVRSRSSSSPTRCGVSGRRPAPSRRSRPTSPTCETSWSRDGPGGARRGSWSPSSVATGSTSLRLDRLRAVRARGGVWAARCWRRAATRRRRSSSGTRSPCGAGRCSTTWRSTTSSASSRLTSTRCDSRPSRTGSRPISRSVATSSSSASWTPWWRRTPCASGCTASGCWPCTAVASRRRPWPPT